MDRLAGLAGGAGLGALGLLGAALGGGFLLGVGTGGGLCEGNASGAEDERHAKHQTHDLLHLNLFSLRLSTTLRRRVHHPKRT
jgi:hypothetical protein